MRLCTAPSQSGVFAVLLGATPVRPWHVPWLALPSHRRNSNRTSGKLNGVRCKCEGLQVRRGEETAFPGPCLAPTRQL